MKDADPHRLSAEERKEIAALPAVREAWGLLPDDDALEIFVPMVYGVKFNFSSGSPGYVGDLYVLQGDALTGDPPMALLRGDDGKLVVSMWNGEAA